MAIIDFEPTLPTYNSGANMATVTDPSILNKQPETAGFNAIGATPGGTTTFFGGTGQLDVPTNAANVGMDIRMYLDAITDPAIRRRLLETEAADRPLWTLLGLQDFERQMFGMDGQQGGIDLLGRLTQRMGEIERQELERQRAGDIQDVERLGGRAIEALRASDPDRAALMARQKALTDQLYASAQGLSPQEQRQAEQRARAASMARGRGYDSSAIAGELLGREEFMMAKRNEAQQSGNLLFNMYQQTGGDPFLAILGRPSSTVGMAQGQQGQQFGMLGQAMGPQLFDPNVGVNVGMTDRANQLNYRAAVEGARMAASGAKQGGLMSMLGSIAGAAIGCWVAREVYGTNDQRWELFRMWLLTLAPTWFFRLYMRYGERVAAWLVNKPRVKSVIRRWMDSRIERLFDVMFQQQEA